MPGAMAIQTAKAVPVATPAALRTYDQALTSPKLSSGNNEVTVPVIRIKSPIQIQDTNGLTWNWKVARFDCGSICPTTVYRSSCRERFIATSVVGPSGEA